MGFALSFAPVAQDAVGFAAASAQDAVGFSAARLPVRAASWSLARYIGVTRHPMSEEDPLIARAATGDHEAFRTLYERHRAEVARLTYRMLGSRADLEDLVQEVFVQVYRSIKHFRGQSKFGTWLHRVTVNVILMHRRAAKSRPVLASDAFDESLTCVDAPHPDEGAARRQRVRAFERLLQRLPEKKRIVFVLHELEGLSPTEIAKVVGAPVLTVRTRLFYARRELEEMLAQEPELAGLNVRFSKPSQAGVSGGGGT